MSLEDDLKLVLAALRGGHIDAAQLAEIEQTWLDRPGSSLAALISERGWLDEEQQTELAARLGTDSTRPAGSSAGEATTVFDPGETVEHSPPLDASEERTTVWTSAARRSVEQARERDGSGSHSGRYDRTRLHATGGLGEIWLAYDRHLGREVALKRMRSDRAKDSKDVARFLDEARINGRLEHPNIVPVYDLIDPPDSHLASYTMRFVHGRTLDEAVAEHHAKRSEGESSPIESRDLLDAFVAVCRAVAYAHSRKVLHRDLKGRNVVLGDFGEVFLLDWGLAKDLERRRPLEVSESASEVPAASPDELTMHGEILGTPAYISPEQAAGEPADERSDIYGLGTILYRILTSRAPYVGGTPMELVLRVREEPPQRPRSVVATIPPALEAICLKAMARDPSQRYGSALDLAEDVRRWLADEPVAAYPEPWRDRLRRWARRNRALVGAAAVLLVTATVALAISNALVRAERRRTEQARVMAVSNFNLARRAVDVILLNVAQVDLPNLPGAQGLRRRVADEAAYLYQSFLKTTPEDPIVRSEAAKAFREIGSIRRLSFDIPQATRAYDQAIEILEGLVARDPASAYYRQLLAEVLIEYAVARRMEGRIPEEEPYLVRAIATTETMPPSDSPFVQPGRIQARALSMLSTVQVRTGRPAEALDSALRANALMAEVPSWPGADSLERFDRIWADSTLAPAYLALGRLDEAGTAAQGHLERSRAFLAESPENNDRRYNLALALLDLADCQTSRAETRAATTAALDEAVAVLVPLTREFAGLPMYRLSLARAWIDRSLLRADEGEVEAAEIEASAARDLLEVLVAESSDQATCHAEMGRALGILGRLAIDAGRASDAQGVLEEALDHTKRALRANPGSPRELESQRRIESDLARLSR